MASRELYSSTAKRKKKVSTGQMFGDIGLALVDNSLAGIGMGDLISPDAYNSEQFGQFTDTTNKIYNTAGNLMLSGTTSFGSKPAGPESFAMGGKKDKSPQELTGPTIRGKQYPKGTIVTNDPNDPRLKAYQDSLLIYNAGEKASKDFMQSRTNLGISETSWNRIKKDYDKIDNAIERLLKKNGEYPSIIKSTPMEDVWSGGSATGKAVRINSFSKPQQPIVYEPFVNRMTPKGMPTLTQPIPQMLNMPDRIEADSRTGAEYKGIQVSHYTDSLGRYTAKLNLSTTPGVRGKISTPYAQGGLRTFEGNTHEQGGIKLGNDEVEAGETMMPMDAQSDFIFSDRITYPGTKQSFATKSKRIESKYKLRPNDPYGKKSQELELRNLAMQQEEVKKTLKPDSNNKKAYGGMKYANGGPWDVPTFEDYMIEQGLQTSTEFDKPQSFLNTNYRKDNKVFPVTSMTPKGVPTLNTPSTSEIFKTINIPNSQETVDNTYQSNFLPTALGYAAQAATNIPSLLLKPEKKSFSRVKFGNVSLAELRNQARRSRNLGLATARGVGAQSGDIGQTMNYLAGTTAGLNDVYGNQFNQSLLQEKQANLESNMREQLANSEIERYEEGINTQEADAIRNLKMQALSNLGTTAAMAGRDYMSMNQSDNMLNVLMSSNPDYTFDVNGKQGLFKQPTLRAKRRALGGKKRRAY